MDKADQFITTTSVVTFGGASLAVVVIVTTVERVLAKTWIVIPFLVSLAVGLSVAATSGALRSPLEWLVAIANSCLLFCTATGANQLIVERPAGGTKPQGRPVGKWFVNWLS